MRPGCTAGTKCSDFGLTGSGRQRTLWADGSRPAASMPSWKWHYGGFVEERGHAFLFYCRTEGSMGGIVCVKKLVPHSRRASFIHDLENPLWIILQAINLQLHC